MIIDVSKHTNLIFGTVNSNSENENAVFSRLIVPQIADLKNSTGVLIKFKTDSACVKVRYSLKRKVVLPHIGATMVNGLFYSVYKSTSVIPVSRGCCLSRSDDDWSVIYQGTAEFKTFEIYLPSFNEVNALFLEIDDGKKICEVDNKYKFNIVFCGGAMTMGAGCLFAAADFSHTVARKLNANSYNLALNANDYLDLRISKEIYRLNADLIVLEAFGVWMHTEHLQQNFESFVESILCSCKSTPIILVAQPYLGNAENSYVQKEKIIRDAVITLNKKYPNRIFLLDGRKYFGAVDFDKLSYSTNIINDWGHKLLSDKIVSVAETFLVK